MTQPTHKVRVKKRARSDASQRKAPAPTTGNQRGDGVYQFGLTDRHMSALRSMFGITEHDLERMTDEEIEALMSFKEDMDDVPTHGELRPEWRKEEVAKLGTNLGLVFSLVIILLPLYWVIAFLASN